MSNQRELLRRAYVALNNAHNAAIGVPDVFDENFSAKVLDEINDEMENPEMNNQRELLKQALESLQFIPPGSAYSSTRTLIGKIKAELEKPDPDPVAWQNKYKPCDLYEYEHLDPIWHDHFIPLYKKED